MLRRLITTTVASHSRRCTALPTHHHHHRHHHTIKASSFSSASLSSSLSSSSNPSFTTTTTTNTTMMMMMTMMLNQQQVHRRDYSTGIRFDRVEEGSIYMESGRYYRVDKVHHNHKSRGGAIISMDSIDLLTGKKYSKRMKSTDTLDVIDPTSYLVRYKSFDDEEQCFVFEDDDGNEFVVEDERVWESDHRLLRRNLRVRLWGHESEDNSDDFTILGAKIEEDTFVLRVRRVREGEGTADRTIKVEVGDFGLVIRLPAHIKEGDYVRLSNQGNYLERAEADEVEDEEDE